MKPSSSIAMEVNGLADANNVQLHEEIFTPKIPTFNQRLHYYHPSETINNYSSTHRKGSGKKNMALTALTLLSFLFFLHMLQSCIQEHTEMMNPQVVIMQSRLADEAKVSEVKTKENPQKKVLQENQNFVENMKHLHIRKK
ncbi:uncharacterized protein LOC115876093 isoform X2 [Sitophilus oryzae]|uniref:Uncharacterized protein LOC115876093 isoform X2 n=1 Tax=Sitophilus oryzae TaxID=7048 RepID=A0A6J2X8U1_SITOR|nr:uncharacterized protein LOC115876093 isoform X2 [Sitophilus oryzae]